MSTANNELTSIVLTALEAQATKYYDAAEEADKENVERFKARLAALGADLSTINVRNRSNETYTICPVGYGETTWAEIEVRILTKSNWRDENQPSETFTGWKVQMTGRTMSTEERDEAAFHLLGLKLASLVFTTDSAMEKILERAFTDMIAAKDAHRPLERAMRDERNRLKREAEAVAKVARLEEVGDMYEVGKVWAVLRDGHYRRAVKSVKMMKVEKVTAKRVYTMNEQRAFNGQPVWRSNGFVDKDQWERDILKNGMNPVCAIIDRPSV